MKRVILIRSNPVRPDPPVEKAALALLKAGYQVTIIGWDRDGEYVQKKDELRISGHKAEVVRFGIPATFSGGMKKNLKAMVIFQNRLRNWLVKHRADYDIIHAFDFDTGLIASRYAKKFRKKFVYHILDYYVASHGLRGTRLEKPILYIENSIINFADATLICTEKRREQIVGTNPKRLAVIHNTPSASQFRPCDPITKQTGRVKIAYVGILEPSRMLKQIAEVVSEDPGLELHVGGFGTLEAFFTEMSARCDNVFYYGRLPYDQTLSLEKECDIMTAIYDPSVDNHRYAAPNKFYESLMLGKPVIMVRGTGMSEVVEANGIGALIDYSREGLIDGITRLVASKDQWPAMEKRMKELYQNQFCWDEMERRLMRIYAELENEKNSDRQ